MPSSSFFFSSLEGYVIPKFFSLFHPPPAGEKNWCTQTRVGCFSCPLRRKTSIAGSIRKKNFFVREKLAPRMDQMKNRSIMLLSHQKKSFPKYDKSSRYNKLSRRVFVWWWVCWWYIRVYYSANRLRLQREVEEEEVDEFASISVLYTRPDGYVMSPHLPSFLGVTMSHSLGYFIYENCCFIEMKHMLDKWFLSGISRGK